MFSRGSRFTSVKASDIPGPGAYNPQDPEYDAYKRGAFLEQTNRFNKEKESDVPGPGTYDVESANAQNRPPTRTSNTTSTDKLMVLQRKLEELERIHVEEKKLHHLEQERLKLELSRAQQTAAEQTERGEKLKKQHDTLEARVQELKKASAAEHAELRDLRIKLRTSEHERTQLAAKQGDTAEARKVEARRKDELRERDRKIAELEKLLAVERKKNEAVEARLQEMKVKSDERVQEALAAAQDLENRLGDATKETRYASDALQRLQARTENAEEELVAQLEQHRYALTTAAQEYGRLASSTVLLTDHKRIQSGAAALQLRNNRLERKLANSDGQVTELANLIRQVKEENSLLTYQLREVQEEADVYRQLADDACSCNQFERDDVRDLEVDFLAIVQGQRAADLEAHRATREDLEMWSALDRARADTILLQASHLNKEVEEAHSQLEQRTRKLSETEAALSHLNESLSHVQTEHANAQRMLADSAASLAESNARADVLKKQLEAVQAETRAVVARAEQNVQQEKQANQRLATSLHQVKQAEQFLRAEVEQLNIDLVEAEKYVEAYQGLLAKVDSLVVKNALAEEEAQRLSKFNAEILGHNNPAQRIMYVDRIRRELHETKHKLLLSTRDKDTMAADNDDLRAELELYKSVAVSQDAKPRTTITRVARNLPATTSELDVAATTHGLTGTRSVSGSELASVPEVIVTVGDDDMTLDEIM